MDSGDFPLKDLSFKVIGAAIEVHRELGPGLLESTYESCLADEFARAGIRSERQVPLPVAYKGRSLDCGYRLDFVVEDSLILELKCVEQIMPIHRAQLLTYLKLAGKQAGLLINFNVEVLHRGIVRCALTQIPPISSASSAPLR